jgi:hypothetical protein
VTPPIPALPRERIRFSASLLRLSRPGLVRMIDSCGRVLEGDTPNPLIPAVYFIDHPDKLSFDCVLSDRIFDLWKRLYPAFVGNRRSRLELDFIDISTCLLAARALRRLVKHRHVDAPRPDYEQALPRFLRLLETYRKRAKRACIKALGTDEYRALRDRWARFARWLQTRSLSCMCRKPYVPDPLRWPKCVLDAVVKAAERELQLAGIPSPQPKKLRRWVRQAVRQVRRHRVPGLGIRSFVETAAGRCYLSRYLKKKIASCESVCQLGGKS